MQLVSVGPVAADAKGVEAAVGKAAGATAAKLAIVYMPIGADHGAILRAVSNATPARVIGSTTGGAAFTERGVTTDGVVVGLLGGNATFDVTLVEDLKHDGAAKLTRAAKQQAARAPAGNTQLLVLTDAFALDGEELVRAVRDGIPTGWRFFGGSAGDDWTFTRSKVFHDGKAIEGAAILVAITTAQKLNVGVLHGWERVAACPSMKITTCEANVVLELDGKPAGEAYSEALRKGGVWKGEGIVPISELARFPLGVRSLYGESLRVRSPLSITRDSIVLAGALKAGDLVHVVSTNHASLIAAAAQLADAADDAGGSHGRLSFDCAVRHNIMGARFDDEVRALRGKTRMPLLGMAGYGEIAKVGGTLDGFHNATSVLVSW